MATADADQELASTPRWFLSLTVQFLAGLVVFGIAIGIGSTFSYLLLSTYYPSAVAFHWLGVSGTVLAFVLRDTPEDEFNLTEAFLRDHHGFLGRSKLVYALSLLTIFAGTVTFLVGTVAIVMTLAVEQTAIGALAIPIAIWYPAVDIWLGRQVGINVGTVGAVLASLLMMFVAVALRVRPSVASHAADDLRISVGVHRVRRYRFFEVESDRH